MRLLTLSARTSKILAAIVENYIKFGQPVGSKKVCKLMVDPPSAATARNEMAFLTFLGLLEQPHVSAGRVPTLRGYRFYIDYLMPNCVLSEYEKSQIYGMFNGQFYDPEDIIQNACSVLSKITKCTSIFTAPFVADSFIREIKFVKIGSRTVVLILVTSSGMVQNQIFNCGFEVNDGILNVFKKSVGIEFEGKRLESLVSNMHRILLAQEAKDIIMVPAFEATLRAVKKACTLQMALEGKEHLFSFQEPLEVISMLDSLGGKEFCDFLFSSSNKTKIYIGNDCGMDVFSNCCIIVEKYTVNIHQGAIVVIGPVGLDYAGIISKMKCIAEIVQNMFSKIISFE